jgi:hypothetical protein
MLDNLKLGYGGTATEMVRLINDSHILDEEIENLDDVSFDQIIKAIHVVQTEMGITGTTAEEAAETISGSKSSLKAAWQDMLSAVGGAGDEQYLQQTVDNFKQSFSTYFNDNLVPSLMTTISNAPALVEAIAGAITSLPTTLLSDLGSNALDAGTGIVHGVGDIVGWLLDSLIQMLKDVPANEDKITEFGEAIGTFIGESLSKIASNIPEIVSGVFNFGASLIGGFIDGLFSGLFGTDTDRELNRVAQEYTDSITDIELSASRSEAILQYMQDLVDKEGAGATSTQEWAKAQAELEESLSGSSEIFTQYGNDVQGALTKLQEMTEELRKQAILNAMQKRLNETYELLGEAYTKKYESEQNIVFAQKEIEAIGRRREETRKAYAKEILDLFVGKDSNGNDVDTTGWTAAQYAQAYNDYGKYRQTGHQFSSTLSSATAFNEAIAALFYGEENEGMLGKRLDYYYSKHGTPEEDRVWNKSEFDSIVDPEVLNGLNSEVDKQKNVIKDSETAINEAKESITQCEEAVAKVTAAIENAEKEIGEGSDDQSESMKNGANDIETGLAALKAKFLNFKLPAITFSNSGNTNKSNPFAGHGDKIPFSFPGKDTGLDTVPYDDYYAKLHKGEAVLTKAEANAWRKGGLNAEHVAGMISAAIEESMSKIAVMMSGEKVGDLTTRRVRNNINAYNYARTRSMGG